MSTEPDISPHPEWSDAALDAEPVLSHRALHRIGWAFVIVLLVILLTVLPPLLNVNRYQRRVAQAISASINRPVHFDSIHLHLLPLPGLTIQNFVVEEDPAFGSEPVLRANTVEARLRLASLWRRRIEVSQIKLLAPSINLVRRPDGRWNLQGVVTQAGYLQSAPTAQGSAGATPRFPYIEATDARINIKAGETKLPWSLLEARLALWLPEQNEWRVRLRGRPLRTDTDVSDVGYLEMEGSLGRGSAGGVMDQPLAISARWSSTPLGETAKLFLGRDTGMRGAASAEMEIRGTPARMQVSSDMHLHNLRRAEFVPRLPMSLDAHCEAEAMGVLHALQNLRCAIPTAQSDSLFQGVFRTDDEHLLTAPDVLTLQAEVPDLLHPSTAAAALTLKSATPGYFLNWLRVISSRIPEEEHIGGHVSLQANYSPVESAWSLDAACICELPPAHNRSPAQGTAAEQAVTAVESATADQGAAAEKVSTASQVWNLQFTHRPVPDTGDAAGQWNDVIAVRASPVGPVPPPNAEQQPSRRPIPLDTEAPSAISGEISRSGVALQYASAALATYAAQLLPSLADDMPVSWTDQSAPQAAVHSQRMWGQPQSWMVVAPSVPAVRPRKHPRR